MSEHETLLKAIRRLHEIAATSDEETGAALSETADIVQAELAALCKANILLADCVIKAREELAFRDAKLAELEDIDKVCDFANEHVGKLQADLDARDATIAKLREVLEFDKRCFEDIRKHIDASNYKAVGNIAANASGSIYRALLEPKGETK